MLISSVHYQFVMLRKERKGNIRYKQIKTKSSRIVSKIEKNVVSALLCFLWLWWGEVSQMKQRKTFDSPTGSTGRRCKLWDNFLWTFQLVSGRSGLKFRAIVFLKCLLRSFGPKWRWKNCGRASLIVSCRRQSQTMLKNRLAAEQTDDDVIFAKQILDEENWLLPLSKKNDSSTPFTGSLRTWRKFSLRRFLFFTRPTCSTRKWCEEDRFESFSTVRCQ